MLMDITVASMINPYPVLDENGHIRDNTSASRYMKDLREMYTQRMQMERQEHRNRLANEMAAMCEMANAAIGDQDEEPSLHYPNESSKLPLTLSSIDDIEQIDGSSWGNCLQLVVYLLAGIGMAYVGASLRTNFM